MKIEKITFTVLIVLIFQSSSINAQQIIGEIYNINDENLHDVIILFKKKEEAINYSEYFLSKNGHFKYHLKENYDTIYIEVRKSGYFVETKVINKPKKQEIYNLKFELKKNEEYELKQVVVVAKQKPFKIKEDTISFNVSSYTDGSERKIEEVIKKLPGVDVNYNTGEIKYKGKSVETVTLDGDNLFGFNYTLGTKNINVDMVEQIEAIDNYAENPLLKGIEQGGKVSLNLKLKKGKMDVSGNIDYGSGWFQGGKQSFNLNSNILGVAKSYKSFSSLAYNNIGANHTPFDYFGFSMNVEQVKERNYFAKKIIPETSFTNLLEDNRANINNQSFANYNAIFKLNPKISVKTNLYFVNDKISSNQLNENLYQFNNENFSTSDNTIITKKPQNYRGDLQIKYNTSKTSLLEYNLRLRQEYIKTSTTVIQNQIDEFKTSLNTNDCYLKQDLLWTKKLSDKKAIQISLFQSYNNSPQTYTIQPSLFSSIAEKDTQESEFKKTFLEGKATYLGSSKRDKYTFTFGANFKNSPFLSRLYNSEETISENYLDYNQNNIFNTGVYNFKRGKWKISPAYSLKILNQKLEQKIEDNEQNQNDIIFEPALNLKYKLNSISFISANMGYNQNTNAEQYFFLNPVLINNRTAINNLPNLDLQNSQRYNVLYFINDLYNQFQLTTQLSFQYVNGNYFSKQYITENTTQIEYFYLPQNNSNWNINFNVSKYIPFIESTLKFTSNYSLSQYKNIVNNSDLRQNKSQFSTNSFFWKTAFEIPVNFESTFTYNYSLSKSKNQQTFSNKSWQNIFKVIVKPNKKWFIILSSDYYLPDTKKAEEQFFFLDATLRYRPKSKKWEANLVFQNITNEDNFEQIQTSDIATSIYRSNLLPRCFLLNLTWNF